MNDGGQGMAVFAQWVVIAAGVWLIGLGLWMALFPRRALRTLAAMGGSTAVHFGEMITRLLVGAALAAAAALSRCPQAVLVVGGFLIVSALILMALPRRWHAGYSTWWAARIPILAVRLVAPFSVIAGAVLIWVMIPGPA